MPNPAEQLIAIIDAWDAASGKTVYMKRSGVNDSNSDLWNEYFEAVGLLVEVEDFIREHEGWLDENRAMLDATWEYLCKPRNDWAGENISYTPLPRLARGALLSMGRHMEGEENSAFKFVTPSRLEALRQTLEEVSVQIGEIPDYLLEHRDYLLDLIGDCFRILDSEDPDLARARALTFEIVGAALPAAFLIDSEESRETFLQRLGNACTTWVRDISLQTVAQIGASAALAHILPPTS